MSEKILKLDPVENYIHKEGNINKDNIISMEKALEDIVPIDWNNDVLEGKYKTKTLIKTKNEN